MYTRKHLRTGYPTGGMDMHMSKVVKDWLLLLLGAFLLMTALFLPLRFALADDLTTEEKQLLSAYQNGELIRIHILANSDSYEDQALKIHVRDTLIDAFGSMLKDASEQSSNAAFRQLMENVQAMQQKAQQCAAANGFSGSVLAEAGILHLPPKQYGSVILPEDDYRALRITIGEGNGQNWWCVLYPQLCLALAQTEETPAERLLFSSARILKHWFVLDN